MQSVLGLAARREEGCRIVRRRGIRDEPTRGRGCEETHHAAWTARILATTRFDAHESRGATAASVVRATDRTRGLTTYRASWDDWAR